ncbi:MAG: hypothetical protein OEW75_02435 [Cyclobacteriaceae bacterium]|nr:hypothetical protein [Cyclobacteriaceae bacterium]
MLFRPLWGISKIHATPSWTLITAGISFIVFGVLYFLADIKHITSWAKPFAPAGRSTLTCYLIPYIWYGIVALSGTHISEWMKSGPFGVIKCLVFASIIVLLTRLFEKVKLQLRL